MNPFSDLKTLVEAKGTASPAMKAIMATTAKIKAKKKQAELIKGLRDDKKGKK